MNKMNKIIVINNKDYNLNIFVEKRNSARASFTGNGINIRLPRHLSILEQNKIGKQMLNWAVEKISKNPEKYNEKTYNNGDKLIALGFEYSIKIDYTLLKKNNIKIYDNTIHFQIANHYNDDKKQNFIKKNLIKILSEKHIDDFKEHVYKINKNYFNEKIGTINLKNFHSKWGQCFTRSGNLDFSVKLLLAPLPIIEYVIIHEISHIIEPNHSKNFWKLVSNIDPNYKDKIKWLKKNGHMLSI